MVRRCDAGKKVASTTRPARVLTAVNQAVAKTGADALRYFNLAARPSRHCHRGSHRCGQYPPGDLHHRKAIPFSIMVQVTHEALGRPRRPAPDPGRTAGPSSRRTNSKIGIMPGAHSTSARQDRYVFALGENLPMKRGGQTRLWAGPDNLYAFGGEPGEPAPNFIDCLECSSTTTRNEGIIMIRRKSADLRTKTLRISIKASKPRSTITGFHRRVVRHSGKRMGMRWITFKAVKARPDGKNRNAMKSQAGTCVARLASALGRQAEGHEGLILDWLVAAGGTIASQPRDRSQVDAAAKTLSDYIGHYVVSGTAQTPLRCRTSTLDILERPDSVDARHGETFFSVCMTMHRALA